jgi:hypothetical protein
MGILVSLLLPSLEKAREATRRAVCLSNNGQIAVGLAKYGSNNNYSLPKANAGIRGGLGIDATSQLGRTVPMGLAILEAEKYIVPEILYCPSWKHPYMQMGGMCRNEDEAGYGGRLGGYPLPGGRFPAWFVGISYHYRATFGARANQAANLLKSDNPSGTAINADMFTRRYVLLGTEYGHFDAYGALYIDGHAKLIKDEGAKWMLSKNPEGTHTSGNWRYQETMWRDFFDE